MKPGTRPPDHESALRHQISTIAIAVSRIMGRRDPDLLVIDDIHSEAKKRLVARPAAEPDERLSILIERAIARLR